MIAINSPETPDDGFLNVQALDPTIIVELRYATENNFTGQQIYDFSTAIARAGTVRKLTKANQLLKDQGFRLKIWDAYRPVESQSKLFNVNPDTKWVAKPNPNFSHQKGVTFDLTLCELDGTEVPMQSGFDDFTDKSKRNYRRKPYQEHNYQVLNRAMQKAGFTGYENEWWDYRDSQMDQYAPASAKPDEYRL
ncbi:M15 family metallopeptidase [Paucilactobacillus suebicus]|uniref:D-alanyl-D-alanine dipeptidase n=1 Tax=Paucilactobacillus suebicus DSM 5007 = KCTC 3549 TaxID=1423807 RepID=A0A0R1VZP4_9LACO|nr:M15 family metallopeptidase [Paucilactobacillus suebicus]KRM10986.1 D-alanyl-D-alanine dipeptidase [Paucilactobacillus suebicus DSM 5007 = KCTC 3549]